MEDRVKMKEIEMKMKEMEMKMKESNTNAATKFDVTKHLKMVSDFVDSEVRRPIF